MRLISLAFSISLLAIAPAGAVPYGHTLAAACANALPLANAAKELPITGPFVAAGVIAACQTEDGHNKISADLSSVEWLDQQAAMLKSALGK